MNMRRLMTILMGVLLLGVTARAGSHSAISSPAITVDTRGGEFSSLIITPGTGLNYGAILVGETADRVYGIANVGSNSLVLGVNVAAPFSVVGASSYSLAPGQSQTITIRYAPTTPGQHTDYVSFTGWGSQSRQVTGSAVSDPLALTGSIVGRITRADTGAAITGAKVTVGDSTMNVWGAGPGTVSGYNNGEAGRYEISGLAPNANYVVVVSPPLGQPEKFYMRATNGIPVVAGQTTTVDIALTKVTDGYQPLEPREMPVVLVRGRGKDRDWNAAEDPESSYWSAVRSALLADGFQEVWDCNQPEAGIRGGSGHVINGEKGIQENARALDTYIADKAVQYTQRTGKPLGEINIVAHSMGGLITRKAMQWGFRYYHPVTGRYESIRVNKVVMLGTPNTGSPLADLALLNGVILWPWQWDSTQDLKTHHVRNVFNPENPWPTGSKLYLLGGGGGAASGVWRYQVGSGLIANFNMFLQPEMVNDGAVSWTSVQGVAYRRTFPSLSLESFPSVRWTPEVPPVFIGSLDHDDIKQDGAVTAWVIEALRGTPVFLAASPVLSMSKTAGDSMSPAETEELAHLFHRTKGCDGFSI